MWKIGLLMKGVMMMMMMMMMMMIMMMIMMIKIHRNGRRCKLGVSGQASSTGQVCQFFGNKHLLRATCTTVFGQSVSNWSDDVSLSDG